jgi:hypothetical protein
MEGTQMSFLRPLVGLEYRIASGTLSHEVKGIIKHGRSFEQIRENGKFTFTERARIDCKYWLSNISAMDDGTLDNFSEDGKAKIITLSCNFYIRICCHVYYPKGLKNIIEL